MTTAYRDATNAIAQQAEALRQTRLNELQHLSTDLRQLYIHRQARVGFGIAGTLGAIAMTLSLLVGGSPSYILLGAWCFAIGVRVVARRRAGGDWDKRLAVPTRTKEPHHDLAMLQSFRPRERAITLVQSLERASVAWPLTAWCLLGPLTLHLLVYLVASGPTIAIASDTSLHEALCDFDAWIGLSTILVGHAHLVFVHASWHYHERQRPWATLGWAVFASVFPGVVLIAIPLALTALTGSVLVTLVFIPMAKLLRHEHDVIQETGRQSLAKPASPMKVL